MKIQESKTKKQESKTKLLVKPKRDHVVIVAQEIKFARLLSGNEKKSRDRSLKVLKKWLSNCFENNYEFKEDDFLRIWKGLFYALWMSDKPLVQEELCENISGILDSFPSKNYHHALMMIKVGFRVLAMEWYGLDQHRIDKCLMMVRRYLRGSLRCVARCNWTESACKMYAKMLTESGGLLSLKTPSYAKNATSMILHVVDCFLEELAKVSEGDISPTSFAELLKPFCSYMCLGGVPSLCTACRRLLTALLRQSELGLEYQDKTKAWEKMGCPEGGPDALELASDNEEDTSADESWIEESSEKPLDPRAGRVDVILPTLPVPSEEIANILSEMLPKTTSQANKRTKLCIQRFKQLAKSSYPLVVTAPPQVVGGMPRAAPAARALITLEKTLAANTDELKLRGLSRKHRKRLLAKSRAGLSIVEEAECLVASQKNAGGDWKVEDTQPNETTKKDSSNKENVSKKLKRKVEKNSDLVSPKKQKLDEKNNAKRKKEKQTSKVELKESVQKQSPSVDEKKKLKNTVAPKKLISEPNNAVALKKAKSPTAVVKKVKNFQKQLSPVDKKKVDRKLSMDTPKRVKFVLKNNSMQETVDYYKSVRQSPSIPFDSSKRPSKTNLKPSTPSPINPFFKKKGKLNKLQKI